MFVSRASLMRHRLLLLAAVSGSALITAGSAGAEAAPGENAVAEVVVTAAPYPVSLDSVTTSVNIVSQEQLDRAPPGGLGDVLNGLPGVRSTFFGPGASRPVIRGLSGPRVLVLQNGVGMVDVSSISPDHAVASEPGGATRIEVLRGPATLAYGGSAIGGVVNILDERVPTTPAAAGPEGRLVASGGTVDDSYSVSGAIKIGKGPWVFAADAVKRESGDYDVPVNPVSDRLAASAGVTPLGDRTQLNTDVKLQTYGVGLSYIGADGYIGASVRRLETQYGVPHPQVVIVGPPPAEGPVYLDVKQTRYDLRGESAVSLGWFDRARFSIGYADYEHAEVEVATGAIGTRFLSTGTEGRLELVQVERDGWQGAIGVQGLTREFEAIGDEAFVPPTKITEVGVFTLQRLDRDSWGVEGGLRFDRRTIDASLTGRVTSGAASSYGLDWSTTENSQEFSNTSASVAVFWRPVEAWFLGLSVSRNGRAPTEFELFADGPHAGTGSYEIGDPTLDSEKVTSYEATLRYSTGGTRAELHVYTARYDGFIQELPTGDLVEDDGTLDPAGELPVFRYSQTDATFNGVEFEASQEIWRDGKRSVSIEGVYDYVRGKTDLGAPARIPSWSATGRVVWQGERTDGELEVRHVGDQDRVATFELPTDGYTMVNAQFGFKPLAERDLTLFVEGRNLGDVEAREHTSFLKDIAPMPGRTLRAGVRFEF